MAPDLGPDLKLSTSKFINHSANEPSDNNNNNNNNTRIAKLDEHLKNLEEEKRKIEVFKCELPLCMFILNNVIDAVKVEVEQFRRERPREFMPVLESKLKNVGGVKVENEFQDKMNWMSSAQLWNDNYSDDKLSKKIAQESETWSFESERKDFGGAFVPFKPFSCNKNSRKVEDIMASPVFCSEIHRPKSITRYQVSSPASSHISICLQKEAPCKARRCWSPELHCRFVAALEQLGGAQVATPKQIRELMKVDGLTNDEVKSHLQKFRLHGRRVGNASVNRSSVMVVGGLWVGKDESGSQSGSPQGPLQLASSSHCNVDGKSESYI